MLEEIKPHLVELRKRIALSVLSLFIAFAVAFTFHEAILAWITAPLDDALKTVKQNVAQKNMTHWKLETNESAKQESNTTLTDAAYFASKLSTALKEAANNAKEGLRSALSDAANAAQKLSVALKAQSAYDAQITTHQVAGTFFVALKVSFFAAILLALPYILLQIWLFIAPGLYEHEKKMLLPFVIGGSVMFFLGVLFAYYIVTPFGFQFLITFGSFLYTPLINIEDYVGFFTKIMFGFGLAFELPVFAYFLGLLGLITDKDMIRFFKYAVIIIFVLAALLTPPDVLTQLLMALPLIILYGVSILIVRAVNPEKDDDEEVATPSKKPNSDGNAS